MLKSKAQAGAITKYFKNCENYREIWLTPSMLSGLHLETLFNYHLLMIPTKTSVQLKLNSICDMTSWGTMESCCCRTDVAVAAAVVVVVVLLSEAQ